MKITVYVFVAKSVTRISSREMATNETVQNLDPILEVNYTSLYSINHSLC